MHTTAHLTRPIANTGRPPRLSTPLLALALATTACSDSDKPLGFTLLQVPSRGPGRCIRNAAVELKEQLSSKYTLRLSVMRRPADVPLVGQGRLRDWDLVCDMALSPKSPPTEFQIPVTAAGATSLRVEAFDADALAYSGQVDNVDLSEPDQTIYLHPANAQSCLQAGWTSAFHSATLLPNGKVALLGGVIGESNRAEISNGQFYTQSAVAVLDPANLSLKDACQPDAQTDGPGGSEGPFPGRAFHQAVLLPSDPAGPYRILLLGGITATDRAAVAAERTGSQPFRISPTETSVAAEAGILTLTFDGSSCSRGAPSASYAPVAALAEVRGFYSTVTPIDNGAALMFVGGAARYTPSGSLQGFDVTAPAAGESDPSTDEQRAFVISLGAGEPQIDHVATLRRVRAGHAAARADRDRVVVLGGVMDGDSAELNSEYGEELSPTTSKSIPVALGALADESAWHTLTAIGLTDADRAAGASPPALLVYGGYALVSGNTSFFRYAFDPSPVAAQLLTVGREIEAAGYQPADDEPALEVSGLHQATPLADGSVLISGGNLNKADCLIGERELQLEGCAVDQLALFELDDGRLRRRGLGGPDGLKLQVERYGHRAVRLLDNTVLISGGIRVDPEATNRLRLVGEQEILNVSTGGPAESHFANTVGRERASATALEECQRRE